MLFNLIDYTKSLKLDHLSKRMPWSEYEKRISRTKKVLKENGLDIGIAYGSEFRPGDTGWLTGYDPTVEASMVVVGSKNSFILGGPSFIGYAKESSQGVEYRLCKELSIKEEYGNHEFHDLRNILREACGENVHKIGILTPSDVITTGALEFISSITDAEIVMFDQYLLKARYEKSENEQEMIRIATKISDWAIEAAIRTAKPGVRELEVSAAADYVMKYSGSARAGIITIVMSGDRISIVGVPGSNKTINEGDLITISCCARWEGLNGLCGRTFVAGGKPNSDQEAFLAILEKAFQLALGHFKFGLPARDVDAIPRQFLRKQGLAPFYSTAHNTGWTECMEGFGGFTSSSDYAIPKNIAHMIDIGVFNIQFRDIKTNQLGGRIEDTIIINTVGITEHLNSMPLRVDSMNR